MSSHCSNGLQNTLNQGANLDYEVFKAFQSAGSLADFSITLQKPRKVLLFVGTDSTGGVDFFLSFAPTGQGSIVKSGAAPFIPSKAANTPIFEFARIIGFEKQIQTFFLSATDSSLSPATYWFVATDQIDVVWTKQ